MANRIIQYPVPLILKKVLKDQSDGELVVVGKNFTKNLFFQQGSLVFAKTNLIEERLGEILFKIGKIDRGQFLNINELIKDRNERIGKILVQNNVLSQRDLFFALIFQLRTIATSTFELLSGEWSFTPKVPEIPDDSRFKIGLAGIISEGTSKIGNVSYFKNKFFSKALKITNIPDSVKEFLSNFDLNFYNDLAKFTNLSSEIILQKLGTPEDVFFKKLVLFYLLNIIEFIDVVMDKNLDKNIEELIGFFEQIKTNRLDYYQVLGIKSTASPEEIKSIYFSLAKKFHPDRISNAPDPEIKEKANFVFAEINKAYETLSNQLKRMEYDSRGFKEDTQEDTIHENLIERGRHLYRRAKGMYAQKQYWEAASIMEEAIRLDPMKSSYLLLLGLSQMNLPKFKHIAAANLQKAIDIEPYNVEAYAAMGILFMSENQPKRAEGFFRKVLSINPDHVLARKKLDEILGSSTGGRKNSLLSIFGKTKK